LAQSSAFEEFFLAHESSDFRRDKCMSRRARMTIVGDVEGGIGLAQLLEAQPVLVAIPARAGT
jgi:hypothetical protein